MPRYHGKRQWTACAVCSSSKQWIWNDRIATVYMCSRCGTPWPKPEEEWPQLGQNGTKGGKADTEKPAGGGGDLTFAQLAALLRRCPDAPTEWVSEAANREQATKAATPQKKPDAMLVEALQTRSRIEGELV